MNRGRTSLEFPTAYRQAISVDGEEVTAVVELAPAFTLDDARALGMRKDEVYRLLHRGEIERIGRGV